MFSRERNLSDTGHFSFEQMVVGGELFCLLGRPHQGSWEDKKSDEGPTRVCWGLVWGKDADCESRKKISFL